MVEEQITGFHLASELGIGLSRDSERLSGIGRRTETNLGVRDTF